MRFALLSFLIAVAPAWAAEVVINGVSIQSRIVTNEYACDGFSILVKENRFPDEFEEELEKEADVENNPVLPGFYGNAITVGATAFVKKHGVEHAIPDVTKRYQKTGELDKKRVYLPALGYCLSKNAFLLSVWSGGNCKQCERLIRYQIDSTGRVVRVGTPSDEEWRKIMSAPLPKPTRY